MRQASGSAPHDKARNALEQRREESNFGQSLAPFVDEHVRTLHRAIDAQQGGIGAFSQGCVTTGSLSERFGRLRHVEHVVDDLKGEAERGAVLGERIDGAWARTSSETAEQRGRRDERTRFRSVDPAQLGEAQSLAFTIEIQHLPADHPARAGCYHELTDDTTRVGGRKMPSRAQGDARRQRHHRQASNGRHACVELAMNGGPAAAYVVIVHARQVVVDERVGVYDFDRCRERRCVPSAARGSIGGEKENSAKALAAAEETVAYRRGHERRPRVERSETIPTDTRERVVDLMARQLDVADDSGVENVGATAISHENR